MIAFVDLLPEHEEHDQAQQRGDGADKQQIGEACGIAGGADDGGVGHRVGAEQAADDGDADGRRDVHGQIVHAHATAGLILFDGAQHCGDDRRVHQTAAGVEHAGEQGEHQEAAIHAERGTRPSDEHQRTGGHEPRPDADLTDDESGASAHDGGDHVRPHDVQRHLRGGHTVQLGADGVEDGRQCVVHEVEHEDQADRT